VKIDIDGQELEVVRGMLRTFLTVKGLLIEETPESHSLEDQTTALEVRIAELEK